MYPLSENALWPLDQWYIAGFASEITEGLLDRTFLNERVVLFRDAQGAPHALSGICPHRMMPMALGTLDGDRLTCGYHGLSFDLNGSCVASPVSSRAPDCKLRRFPIREVGPLIWIWLGDIDEAEVTPLPAQQSIGLGNGDWLTQCVGHVHLNARYTLLMDNLFDLSHLAFIHESLVGKYAIAFAESKVEEIDGRLHVSRTLRGVPSDNQQRFLFPHIGPTMTTQLASELIAVGLINAGGPTFDGADEQSPRLGQQNFVHGFTPETAHTTHYWLMMTRDFRKDDSQLSAQMAGSMQAVTAQDVEALEAIEKLLESGVMLPKEISMKSDAGALRARLRLTQMIRRENGQDSASGIHSESDEKIMAAGGYR